MPKLIHILAARKVRKNFGNGDKKRDAGQKTPENVIRFDNIRYSKTKKLKKWQLLDVYRPKLDGENIGKNSSDPSTRELKKLPVIVSIHGGAWVYGDKDVYQFYCMKLAQHGFAVVNFSYRLAPEAKFPSSLIDTENVFRWIASNANEYGFDLNNVFALGDSAGAHLLSLYASIRTNNEYAQNFEFIDDSIERPSLRGIALNCGKYDMAEQLEKDAQMQLLLQALMPDAGSKEELELINGAAHITSNFPPTFVMTCLGDFLFQQAPIIVKALEAAGVKHEYHCYGSQEKPLWHVFHCDPKLEEAVLCNDDECNFFKSLII